MPLEYRKLMNEFEEDILNGRIIRLAPLPANKEKRLRKNAIARINYKENKVKEEKVKW